MNFLVHRLAAFVFLVFLTHSLHAQTGANMFNSLIAGSFPGNPYQDTRNNAGYTNDIGNSSPDIYYKVEVNNAGTITASHCLSSFDTYMFLLDDKGSIVASNDDNNGCSGYYQANIKVDVDPGTYYVVSEGWNTNIGNITTRISFDPAGSRMDNAIEIGELIPGDNFQDVKNNLPSNQYMDNYGRPSQDFYHTFTISTPLEVTLSHCGSAYDTYMYLIDANGNLVTSNDDNTTCGLQARINITLSPGKYYVVSETYYASEYGNIILNATVPGQSPEPSDTAPLDPQELAQLEWYDNNDYLEHFLDSIGYDQQQQQPGSFGKNSASTSSVRYGIKYWIPIQIYYLAGAAAGDIEVRNAIQRLNALYANNRTNTQFYLKCSPIRLSSTDYSDLSSHEEAQLSRKYSNNLQIDIFITAKIQHRDELGLTLTGNGYKTIFITEKVFRNDQGTLAHEIGHKLGLLHTHEGYEWVDNTEPIDRSRRESPLSLHFKPMCEYKGDALRDTPADPNLRDNEDNLCRFILTGLTDPWGDSYSNPPAGSSQPMTTNLMSYNYTRTCRTQFTRLQVAVMLHWLDKKSIGSQLWSNSMFAVDTNEPNNSSLAASPISIGETQTMNFHFDPGNFNGTVTSCDMDWVTFTNGSAGIVNIRTWATGLQNAYTKLTLYERDEFTPVVSSIQTGSDPFSQLSYNCKAGVRYFIKVENRQPSINGFYNLTVGCDLSNLAIQGPDYFCGQATYQIVGLPTNSTINWSQSGNLTGSVSNDTYTVSGSSSEFVTLSAVINSACSGPVTITKQVAVNNPNPPPGENMINGDTPYQPGGYTFFIPMYQDISYYEWYVSGPNGEPYHSQDGTNYCYVNMDYPGWYTLNVKGTNSCGDIWFDNQQLEVYVPNAYYNYSYYSYSPNPASTELVVSYDNSTKDKLEKNNKPEKVKKDFEIKLLDSKGKIISSGRNTDVGNKITLNTIDIPDGTYFLHIIDGKETIRKQVIIKH